MKFSSSLFPTSTKFLMNTAGSSAPTKPSVGPHQLDPVFGSFSSRALFTAYVV